MLLKNDYPKDLLCLFSPVTILFISVPRHEHLSLPNLDLFSSLLRRDHNKITGLYVPEISYTKLFSQCLSAQLYHPTVSI